MAKGFLKTFSWISAIFTSLTLFVSFAVGEKNFTLGLLAGAAWFYLNLFFLFQLLEIAMRQDIPKNKNKIFLLSVFKFPVLYLTGFFILRSHWVSVGGVLAGLTVVLMAFGGAWVFSNTRLSRVEGNV